MAMSMRTHKMQLSSSSVTAPRLLVVAAVFHLVYVFSIFDIYFRSPIDTGIVPVQFPDTVKPPAKRLVLFVADGLRADTCFNFMGRDTRYHHSKFSSSREHMSNDAELKELHFQAAQVTWPTANTSFLRGIIETTGSWGVSHTQVPTESRPGHVAMIAGFNEDVSAVTKGWQDNPVDFDHVFNQSARTWAWGSPDITRMFAKRHEHVIDTHYSSKEEDFAAKDLTWLDTWVFNHVSELLERSKLNVTLHHELHEGKVVLFLHLLGLDSNGHANRPHSPEYTRNMALVDRGVAGIYNMIQEYFGDDETAYVFTADHGMAAQGSHGDGDPANTRTPIIAWGAGISSPQTATSDVWLNRKYDTGFDAHDERKQTVSWGLGHLLRRDMQQADLAPLMSSLIGVPVPVNSVGMLPHSFLAQSEYRAVSSLVNARQLLRQVHLKERLRRERMLWFVSYPGLTNGSEYLSAIQNAVDMENWSSAESLSLELFTKCKGALQYYQTYDWVGLCSIIVLGYIGWVASVFMFLIKAAAHSNNGKRSKQRNWAWMLTVSLSFVVQVKFLLERAPPQYFVYLIFPSWFWTSVLQDSTAVRVWFRAASHRQSATRLVFFALVLQLMVLGYTYRWMYAGAMAMLSLWPLITPELQSSHRVRVLLDTNVVVGNITVNRWVVNVSWTLTCCTLGAFTFLPLDTHNSMEWMVAGGAAVLALCAILFFGPWQPNRMLQSRYRTPLQVLQLSLIVLATMLALHTDNALSHKHGLDRRVQVLTWIVFTLALVLPLFSASHSMERYASVLAGLAPPYILLSINFEVLFYAVLGAAVLQWILIERVVMHERKKDEGRINSRQNISRTGSISDGSSDQVMESVITATIDDIRVGLMFLLFVHMAFFGTGNIASMSSFQLPSTYRFVTVFSPFLMGGLLVFKLLVPYTLVTALVSTLAHNRFDVGASPHPPSRMFLVVLALCDLMAVQLFFFVRNTGSWKEIGNSISQFGFINAQLIFLPLLFLIARVYMGRVDDKSVVVADRGGRDDTKEG